MIEDNRLGGGIFLVMTTGFERLGEGSIKLRKPLYLISIIIMAICFILFTLLISVVLVVNPLLIEEEGVFLALIGLPRIGMVELMMLIVFMRRGLNVPRFKQLALVSLMLLIIGIIVFSDLMATMSSLVMAYNSHSVRKRI